MEAPQCWRTPPLDEARTVASPWRVGVSPETSDSIPERPAQVVDKGEGTWEIRFVSDTQVFSAVVLEVPDRLIPEVVVTAEPKVDTGPADQIHVPSVAYPVSCRHHSVASPTRQLAICPRRRCG
jgi:hypothetical protein